jgi:hypothetical protein
LCSSLKRTSFCSVAEYSLTGMVTIPKLIAPFQIGRIGPYFTRFFTFASSSTSIL